MIKPSVGRIVLYHPHALDGGDVNGQPHPAIVAHVHDERLINLTVFNENGSVYSKQGVTLVQGDEAEANLTVPTSDFAEWMPYQKGQTQKADSAESVLLPRLAALEESVATRFAQTGEFLEGLLSRVQARLDSLPTPTAADPATAKPQAGADETAGGAGAGAPAPALAPGAAPEAEQAPV